MKRLIIVVVVSAFLLSSCMINSDHSADNSHIEDHFDVVSSTDADTQTEGTSPDTAFTEVNLKEPDEDFFNRLYDDIYRGIIEKKPYIIASEEKSYDTLPGIEALSLKKINEKDSAIRILGKPLVSAGSGISIWSWSYKCSDGSVLGIFASVSPDCEFLGWDLAEFKIRIVEELLKDDNTPSDEKSKLKSTLTELSGVRDTFFEEHALLTIHNAEYYCGYEVPLIYSEEYITALHNVLDKAISDYKKSLS